MSTSTVRCSYCQKPFQKDTRHVTENVKLGHKFFCSRKCMYTSRLKKVTVICDSPTCRKEFTKSHCQLSPHNFCSHSCSASVTNVQRVLKRPKKRCVICGEQIQRARTYCSPACAAQRFKLSKEALITKLQTLARTLKRSPSRRECSSSKTCMNMFGSWNNALIQAGLEPNRSLNQRMYKRRKCLAKDGHACNSISELIIDNWLSEHGIQHEKESPYPVGKSVADWKIRHNILVEYFGLAKDSKRYDLAIEKKRKICREQGVPLVEIYSQDLFPVNKLQQIFVAII